MLSEPPIQPGKPDSVADISTDNRVGLNPDNLGVLVGTRSVVFTDAHNSGRNGSVGAQTLDVSAPDFVPPTTTATAVGAPAMLAGRPLVTAATTNSRDATNSTAVERSQDTSRHANHGPLVGSVKTGEHRLTTRGTPSASESSGRVWGVVCTRQF